MTEDELKAIERQLDALDLFRVDIVRKLVTEIRTLQAVRSCRTCLGYCQNCRRDVYEPG